MKIAVIAAGAADMYCGSCLRDGTLAIAMRALGHDVTLVPTYTPLKLDEDASSEEHVFVGGVEVFVHEKFGDTGKRRGLLRRFLGSQALLRWLGRRSLRTDPRRLGPLTVSMLQADDGPQATLIAELVDWLHDEIAPDVVHLTNSLYAGFARPVKEKLGVPVACGLSGEDLFLEQLPEPHRSRAIDLLHSRSAHVDRFVSPSRFAKERMSALCGLNEDRIDVVYPGLRSDGDGRAEPSGGRTRAPTVGFLSRIAPEKGLHVLVEAFKRLARTGVIPDIRLQIAGYLGAGYTRYASLLRRNLALAGLSDRVDFYGTVSVEEKARFLSSVDVLAVPTEHPEAKGLFVLEAFARGVPVVQPAHGVFPELVELSNAGLLHAPRDAGDLAEKLAELLSDPERLASLRHAARAAAREHFSAERMASETLSVYERLTP